MCLSAKLSLLDLVPPDWLGLCPAMIAAAVLRGWSRANSARIQLPVLRSAMQLTARALPTPAASPRPRGCSTMPAWVIPSQAAAGTVMPCLFCDGAARGNPGQGAAGAILFSPGGLAVLAFEHKRLGDAVTNNAAEYRVGPSPPQERQPQHLSVYRLLPSG